MDVPNLFEQNGALIRAAKDANGTEPWSDEYKKDPESFAKLLKAEARIERVMLQYFADLADRAPSYINWTAYMQARSRLEADSSPVSIDVIVSEEQFLDEDNNVMREIYDPVEIAARLGVEAGEAIYFKALPENTFADVISTVAKRETASLVGKRVNSDGTIVDNPKAKYRISDTTRKRISNAISTSLSLREDQAAATLRMQQTIKDPKRAAKIAQTEAVNGYQGGMHNYARTAGAVKKEWQGLNTACSLCMGNIAAGNIGIDEYFPSKHLHPACHPGDRCGVRYTFPEELA
jgi:hypothetical protein